MTEAVEFQPKADPEVVAILEEALEDARSGNMRAVVLAGHNGAGDVLARQGGELMRLYTLTGALFGELMRVHISRNERVRDAMGFEDASPGA